MNKPSTLKRTKVRTRPIEPPQVVLPKQPKPNWGLYESDGYPQHGISYSLLSNFIVCRERFRLRTVEGMVPKETSGAMEFGTIFHKALELSASGMSNTKVISYLRKKERAQTYDLPLSQIVRIMLPLYKAHWQEDVLSKINYFESEKIFEIPYTCSLGRTVTVRGKRDEGFRKGGRIWLQENKTKSQISDELIVQTLSSMLQPMIYLLSFKHDHPNEDLGGILYNVIRKPGLKRGKKETERDFLARIQKDIESRPDHYFKMYEVEIDDAHLNKWIAQYFDPLISQVCVWWESIRSDPFNPWETTVNPGAKDEVKIPNPNHFIRPFGVYDPMSRGLGDYFGPIVQGTSAGFEKGVPLFQELKEEDE